MLLRGLSDKARANVERTNKGEKAEGSGVRVRPRAEREHLAPQRTGAVDPSAVDIDAEFFIKIVESQDAIAEEKRHNTGYTHVSTLLRGMCARKVRFQDEAETPEYEWAGGAQRIIWKMGRAAEKHIRESYIKGIKGKGVIGKWSCKCGRTTYEGEHRKQPACGTCRTAPLEYDELTLLDHEAGVCGNPDMLVMMGKDGKLYVVEIKSLKADGDDGFDALVAAKPDHVYQAASYRRLLIANGYENVSEKVLIIYVNKKYAFRGSPYKSFMVDVDIDGVEAVLDGAWEAARLVRRSRIDGTIPERTECSSPQSQQAKKCPFVVDCFGRS